MAKYSVTLPVTGYCLIDVEANNAEEAIEKAFDLASAENLETWETHRSISTGNVCHAEINEAEAVEIVGS